MTSILVTHQIRDAFYIATHKAVSRNGHIQIESMQKPGDVGAEFIVLHEGPIRFEGTATELLASHNSCLRQFSGDREMASVIAPFLAFRGLVLANPLWYPQLQTRIRRQLINFARMVLATDRFQPLRVNEYCDG